MATRFQIYYQSPENGAYLRQVIEEAAPGVRLQANDLAHLPAGGGNGADVVFLEYQEQHPGLEGWIRDVLARPQHPEIFLYTKEVSVKRLWQVLALGVREFFTFPIGTGQLEEAMARAGAASQ